MAKATEATIVRKMSSKVIMGGKPTLDKDQKRRDLYNIAGIARRSERGESQYGEFTRFTGDFMAVNLETGEVFRSNRCFLPDIVSVELEQGLAATEHPVEFAFKVSIIADDSSATGYVYHCEPVQKIQQSDALAALAAKIGVNDALPAPKDEPKKGGEKGDKKTGK